MSKKKSPRVRLELTTYRLTAGRATDCAIQDLMILPETKFNSFSKTTETEHEDSGESKNTVEHYRKGYRRQDVKLFSAAEARIVK